MLDFKPTEASHHLADSVTPLLGRAVDQASTLAHQGVNTVREGTQALRTKAAHASESTVDYVRHEPVKAVLMAAATGAILIGVLALLGRTRR